MKKVALLTSAYFGPIQWYQKLCCYDTVYIEQHDSFVKQTYRNRCVIASANGPLPLTVPIERAADDIRISDHGNWRHVHRQAVISAYGESPFFEFYADDILPLFEQRWELLYDFNLAITRTMCRLLDIEPDIRLTPTYAPTGRGVPPYVPQPAVVSDYRESIRPRHPQADACFTPRPYYQVYSQRHGFLPNLSILDLLFNMGNESLLYLR